MTNRVVKKAEGREAVKKTVRRVQAKDKRFADYSSLKASTGIVLPEVQRVLLDRKKAEGQKIVRRGMYPSEMSRHDWCPRATYYRMSGRPEPESKTSFSLENVFAEGNAIHNKWQGWLSDTGLLWGDWKCYRCGAYIKDSLKPPKPGEIGVFTPCTGTEWVSLNGGTVYEQTTYDHDWHYKEVTLKSASLPLSGHADGGLVKHNCLIELKSLGIGTLRFEAPKLLEEHTHDVSGRKIIDIDGIWRDFHRPLPAHIRQGNLYLWMSREMGLPFDRISFVYEAKFNQRTKEFIVPYSESIVAPMLETAHTVVAALAVKTAPACPHGGCGNCKVYEKEESSTP